MAVVYNAKREVLEELHQIPSNNTTEKLKEPQMSLEKIKLEVANKYNGFISIQEKTKKYNYQWLQIEVRL